MADDITSLRSAAQARLSDCVETFNSGFEKIIPYRECLGRAVAVTGEDFVEISSDLGRCISLTPDHAISEWVDRVWKYAAGRKGTVYWRTPPEIDCFEFKLREEWMNRGVIRAWKVYARLLISDLPPKRTSIQEQYMRTGAVEMTNG